MRKIMKFKNIEVSEIIELLKIKSAKTQGTEYDLYSILRKKYRFLIAPFSY